MRKFKKVFTVLMSVMVLAVGSFASTFTNTTVSAVMYGDFEYNVDDNLAYIYKYKGSEKNVDIPDKIDGKTVTAIENSAFQECKSIESVNIPDGVKSIGSYTFYGCLNLKKVNIGSGLSEVKSNVFIRCFDLEEINVDENNQSFSSDDGVLFSKNQDILVKCPAQKAEVT